MKPPWKVRVGPLCWTSWSDVSDQILCLRVDGSVATTVVYRRIVFGLYKRSTYE